MTNLALIRLIGLGEALAGLGLVLPAAARSWAAKKTQLYAVYDSLPELDPKYVKQTREYLDEFFEVIGNPRKMKRR